MRILVLTPDAFGGNGGIALYTQHLLHALCAYPSCTEVVAIVRHLHHAPGPLPPRLTYVTSGVGGKFRFGAAALATVLRNPRFDLIVCSLITFLPLATLLRGITGAPLVLVMYGIDAWEPTKSPLANACTRFLTACITMRPWTLARFQSWARVPKTPWFHLPNALDSAPYRPGPKNDHLLQRYGLVGKRVLLALGRLAANEPRKGFDEVLEALPGLLDHIPNCMYLIVGEGADRARLEGKARTLGMEKHVVFTGYIPEEEKADHLRLADVFAMPGSDMTFDRYPRRYVLLEALACGIPVVVSSPDGPGETASPEAQAMILVDPRDPQDVLRGILAAFARPRGSAPDALRDTAYPVFEQRVHQILERVLPQGKLRVDS